MAQQIIAVGSAPNDGQGDTLRDSFVKTNDNFTELYNNLGGYLFQVGVPASGHIHYALLTTLEAKTLVQGTDSLIPVADPAQPSVVITSAENGPSPHTHSLTVYFDYVNHTFIVTLITNNDLDNHEASLIGTAAPAFATPAPFTTVNIGDTAFDLGNSTDHNSHYRTSSATAVTITVPPDSNWTEPMPIGGTVLVGKHAAGDVTFVAGSGVTINTPDSLSITKLNGKISLIKVGTNEWDIEGNLASA